MRFVHVAAALGLAALASLSSSAALADGPLGPLGTGWTLKGVVVVSRHGMRNAVPATHCQPGTAACIDGVGDKPWPDLGVSAGNLLPENHSRAVAMGRFYRALYSRDGVLVPKGCPAPDAVAFATDPYERTVGTVGGIMDGMFPGCAFPQLTVDATIIHGPDCALDKAKAAAASRDYVGGSWKAFAESKLAAALAMLSKVVGPLDPAVCAANHAGSVCTLATLPIAADDPGPLHLASEPSEQFLMQYGSGRAGEDLGWGRLPAATGEPLPEAVRDLAAVHVAVLGALSRPLYQAVIGGSQSLSSVTHALAEIDAGKGPRFRLLVSHDSMMSNVAGMLGLNWQLDGYLANQIAPGQSIAFEMWQPASGGSTAIRIVSFAATPEQLHDDVALSLATPPAAAVISIPACSNASGACGWSDFEALARRVIDPACVNGSPP